MASNLLSHQLIHYNYTYHCNYALHLHIPSTAFVQPLAVPSPGALLHAPGPNTFGLLIHVIR